MNTLETPSQKVDVEPLHEPARLGGIEGLLLFPLVAFLPFSYAGTISIGFPLKIYEIAAGLLFLYSIIRSASNRPSSLYFLPQEKTVIKLAALFFVVGVSASFFGQFIISGYKAQIAEASWRENPLIYSVLKCGYLFIDIFCLYYLVGCKSFAFNAICNCWLIGGLLAGIYGWYLFVFSVLGHNPPMLPGQLVPQINGAFLPQAIRSGTFLEGNILSPYYLVTAVLAFTMYVRTHRFRYILAGLFFLGSIVHTLSTVGFLAASFFIIFGLLLIAISSRAGIAAALPVFLVLLIVCSLVATTDFFQQVVVEKLTDDSSATNASSLALRTDTINAGWEMFKDHPLLGVGLSNFGPLYPYYTQYVAKEDFDPAAGKNIPNNIYAEVLTETGLVGIISFGLFCLYLIFIYKKGPRHLEQKIMLSGLLSLFVAWVAYPTFSILFQWVYFALAVRIFLGDGDGNTADQDFESHAR